MGTLSDKDQENILEYIVKLYYSELEKAKNKLSLRRHFYIDPTGRYNITESFKKWLKRTVGSRTDKQIERMMKKLETGLTGNRYLIMKQLLDNATTMMDLETDILDNISTEKPDSNVYSYITDSSLNYINDRFIWQLQLRLDMSEYKLHQSDTHATLHEYVTVLQSVNPLNNEPVRVAVLVEGKEDYVDTFVFTMGKENEPDYIKDVVKGTFTDLKKGMPNNLPGDFFKQYNGGVRVTTARGNPIDILIDAKTKDPKEILIIDYNGCTITDDKKKSYMAKLKLTKVDAPPSTSIEEYKDVELDEEEPVKKPDSSSEEESENEDSDKNKPVNTNTGDNTSSDDKKPPPANAYFYDGAKKDPLGEAISITEDNFTVKDLRAQYPEFETKNIFKVDMDKWDRIKAVAAIRSQKVLNQSDKIEAGSSYVYIKRNSTLNTDSTNYSGTNLETGPDPTLVNEENIILEL